MATLQPGPSRNRAPVLPCVVRQTRWTTRHTQTLSTSVRSLGIAMATGHAHRATTNSEDIL